MIAPAPLLAAPASAPAPAPAGPPASAAPTGRPDRHATVVQGLRAGSDGGLVFLDAELHAENMPLGELRACSEDRARVLIGHFGVAPGERVCVFGPTTPAMVATLMAIWRIGAVAVVLPMPRRLDPVGLLQEVGGRVTAAQSRLVLTTAELGAAGVELPGVDIAGYDPLSGTRAARLPAEPTPDDLALLQFTSGTVSKGRAVPVRHGQMVANPVGVLDSIGMGPGDTLVSWLPLFHDMGVLTMVASIAAGLRLVLLGTETFVSRPATWLRAVSTYRASVTAAPNFAYGLAASHLALDRSPLDLSSLRCAVNGAEVVDRRTLERFVAAAGKRGMAATSMCPMYGLAEATLAVSVTSPHEPARFLRVDRDALAAGDVVERAEAAGSRDLACCGRALPGTTVVITDDDGRPVPDGVVGEVRVLGPGVVGRYWTADGSPHPERMCDDAGRLMTGDLGFLRGGELYLCGRSKDMVIVGGRNLYPEDYEFLAERVPGVRTGNVMAFSLPDLERMVVVAETRLDAAQAAGAAREVLDTLRRELSYAPYEAVLVASGTLPKTSSGKRSRRRCRSEYLAGKLNVIAVAR